MSSLIDHIGVNWTPHHYQLRAIEFLKETGCGNLWLAPGLGKTSITLATLCEYLEFDKRPVLVVAPLRPANEVWPREIKKWSNFRHLRYTVLHGPDKDLRFSRMEGKDIVIINYDGLQWLIKKLNGKNPFSALVLDESPAIKNSATKRYECIEKLARQIPRRWLLTGTPASNSLMDLFAPQTIVDKGATFGKWFTHFRNTYFEQPSPFNWQLKEGAEELIYSKMAPSTLRLAAEDYLDMPELIENDVFVTLPHEAKLAYDKLEKECIVSFLEGNVSAVNSAVSVMKLQQIANGAAYLDSEMPNDGDVVPTFVRKTQHIHDAKTEAALELVEEIGGKGVLIAFHYKHDYDRLKKAFPNAPAIKSGLKPHELTRTVDEWNAGKHPVLLVHAQSAGHGLNLQEFGVSVIWYSNTYSRDLYDQLIARVYRQGQTSKFIIVHRIIALNTIDHAIVGALAQKGASQESLFRGVVENSQNSD
jgi:SNF2 family DNA or RNA helicase